MSWSTSILSRSPETERTCALASSSLSLYLGVDGGASGTRALLIDSQATILGFGTGGNANHAGQGYEQAVAHVLTAVMEALQPARVNISALDAIYFAIAGDDVVD